ncbi:MAG: hypothetical protein ACREHE_03220 [Rhizomicrobium sp.]
MTADGLTGIWHGLYTYPSRGTRVLFDATLIESGWLTGSTHEICATGAFKGRTICATLEGSRAGNAVRFDKTYDPGIPGYTATIAYGGVLSADATEIEGSWTVSANWGGKFLMLRSTGKKQAVDAKAFARI